MDHMIKIYYHDYKKTIVTLLLISGMWPDDSRQSKSTRLALASFSLVIVVVTILGVLNFTIHNSRSIIGIVAGIGSIVSFSTVYIKTVAMMLLWRDVKSLNGGLSALFESDLKVAEYRVHLLAYFRAFYRLFKVHSVYCAGFVVFSTSVPIVAALRGNYIRTYAIRVPFDYVPGGTLHWIIFVFEVVSGSYLIINTVGVDTVFGLYALHMVGELRLLSHRFSSLKAGEDYETELKDCVDRHCLLVDYKYKIDKVFGAVSAWLALSCAIIICSIIFQITQGKNVSLFKIIFAVDYIMVKLLQAYTYAWFGNTITVESERCVEAIYNADWTATGNLRFMKDVLIIRSQSPLYINALGIMIVRLDMFMKIAHASVSYFFLLKTIEKKISWAN